MKDFKLGLILLVLVMSLSMTLTSCIYRKPSNSGNNKPGDDSSDTGNTGDSGDNGEDEGDGQKPAEDKVDAGSTKGIVYEILPDGNAATVKEYTGTAANVVISSSFNDVPVTDISASAFEGLKKMRTVTVPDTVTKIGDGAFKNCILLSEITLPEGVTDIGSSAYSGCSALIGVTLPYSLKTIGADAFNECTALKNLYVAELDGWCNTQLGNNASSPLLYADKIFVGGQLVTSAVIGNAVSEISEYVLASSQIKSISLPIGIKSIAKGAFAKCTALESLTLPYIGGNSLENRYLGYLFGASSYSENATSVPQTLKNLNVIGNAAVGNNALSGCSSLKNISFASGIGSIGSSALSGCTGIKTLVIPDSVTNIGKGALSGCTSIESITLPFVGGTASQNRFIGYIFGATEYTAGANLIPQSLNTVTVTGGKTLDDGAFYGCSGLSDIILPETLVSIGADAFNGCKSLSEFTVSDTVKFIGKGAFGGCIAMVSITLPHVGGTETENTHFGYIFGADSYEQNAEFIPRGLRTVVLSTAATISDHAFENCSRLTKISIPTNVASIGFAAFKGCTGLINLALPFVGDGSGANTHFGYVFGADSYEKNAEFIPTSLKSVSIFNTSGIGDYAFAGCSSLTNIDLTYKVSTIGSRAFSGCSGLSSFTVKYGVSYVGENAFEGCTNLTLNCMARKKPSGWKSTWNPDGREVNWSYVLSGETEYGLLWQQKYDKTSITGYNGELVDLVIPDQLNGNTVTAIGEKAFMENKSLRSIVIPNTITLIDKYAFYGCESLTNISFSSALTRIEIGALYGSAITSVTVPASVEYIGESVFSYCRSLQTLIFESGSSIKKIDTWAFKESTALAEVYIESLEKWLGIQMCSPESNPLYYAKTFYVNDEPIITAEIPSTITTIGSYAFCSPLFTRIVLHEGVTQINNYAFNGCSHLNEIVIPASVQYIGENAFAGCTRLSIYAKMAEASESWGSEWNARRPVSYGCITNGISREGFSWVQTNADSIVITGYFGEELMLNIPKTIAGVAVKAIAYSAFRDQTKIVSANIPSTVERIDKDAFKNCSSLSLVIFEDANGWARYANMTSTSGTAIPAEDLSNGATLLVNTYSTYYWRKTAATGS